MSPGDRVTDLLERWVECQQQGTSLTVDELCADDPELRNEVESGIQKVRQLQNLRSPASVPSNNHPSVPGYEILGLLAHGGQGVVYKTKHVKLKRLAALKMIITGNYASKSEIERFRREAEALAQFHHPNIVQIHEIGEYEGRPFLSLEFVDGGNLVEKLAGVPQPARQAAELIHVLARAISFALQNNVIHRDLKPANILLTRDGAPKITDFGLAKNLTADDDLSKTGNVMGTPSYMAPEQARGGGKVGPAVDIYSLGAILYETLTGRPPFRGANPLDTLDQLLHSEPVPPRHLQPKLPRDLDIICLKCLEKSPASRYLSAHELADDLDRFLHGRPILARPVNRWNRLRRWCGRNPVLAANVAFALTAVLVAVITLTIAVVQVSRARDHAMNLASSNENLAHQELQQREQAEQERKHAKREAAYSALERGRGLHRLGEGGRGLLWHARALELAGEAEDFDLQRAVLANLAFTPRQTHILRTILPLPIKRGMRPRAVFSPDGKLILTAGHDESVRLWDASSGELLGEPLRLPARVGQAAFHPRGDKVLTSDYDGHVCEWDISNGRFDFRRVFCQIVPSNNPIVFSPDGQLVLTGADTKFHAQLRNANTGEGVGASLPHMHEVLGAAFTPDGKFLLTASYDGRVRKWEVAALKGAKRPVPAKVKDPVGKAWDVAVAPSGKWFVTATSEGVAQRWDTDTFEPIGTEMRHQGPVHAVACRQDGAILTASLDGNARLWDAETGQMIANLLPHQGALWSVCFSNNGTAMLSASDDGTAKVWISSARSPRDRLLLKTNRWMTAVAFQPGGELVAAGGHDGKVGIWNSNTGSRVCEVGDPQTQRPDGGEALGNIISLVFAASGDHLLTGTQEGTARIWRLPSGESTGLRVEINQPLRSMAYHPNGKMFVTPGQNGSVTLWDACNGAKINEFAYPKTGHNDSGTQAVWALAIDRAGTRIAAGYEDGTMRIWGIDSHQLERTSAHHRGKILCLAFHPNGQAIVSGSADSRAIVEDVLTGELLSQPLSHAGPVNAVAYSPDGRSILTGSSDGAVQLWDVATGERIGPAFLHSRAVRGVAFRDDGRLIATCGYDATVRVWEVPAPLGASPERVRLWAQVSTGMELTPNGGLAILDFDSWRDRRALLRQLGGPPE